MSQKETILTNNGVYRKKGITYAAREYQQKRNIE
jgi:hypothetical protein